MPLGWLGDGWAKATVGFNATDERQDGRHGDDALRLVVKIATRGRSAADGYRVRVRVV